MKYKTINDIARAVITDIKTINNPFESPIIVFHNTKIAQWFKAFYLKEYPEVLMNVKFMTLNSFINNEILNSSKKYSIITRNQVKDYIVKVLLTKYSFDSSNTSNPINYIFNKDSITHEVNGINLYEFAEKLSSLFNNYEFDNEDINSWVSDPQKAWEKDLYDEVTSLAKSDNCYTAKSLFESIKSTTEFEDAKNRLTSKVYIVDNSNITAFYNEVLNAFNHPEISIYSLDNPSDSISCDEIIAAPSILREVEAVHSRICKIVKDNPTIRFNDIAVFIPNLNDYVNTINQVFKQDDKEYPSIPYRIVGASKDQKDMISSLNILFDIANKQYFTRKDFNLFVKNSMVKYVWDIADEEIASWMNVIDATNTYRNGKDENDWDYLRKTLSLSILVSNDSSLENVTSINGKEYLPFQSIDVDFASQSKLIDIINALLNWCDAFTNELNNLILNKNDLEKMEDLLDALYSKKGSDGEESNYLYRIVLDENERLIELDVPIPANTWIKLLLDAPTHYASHPADMFVNGVTFINLTIDNNVSEPYTFIMGLSSNNFPRVSLKSEIDYSLNHNLSEDLDNKALINILNGVEHCICSYVNKDLQKDAELYPSPCITAMTARTKTTICLDEYRDYGDLYTRKEFLYKNHYKGLTDSTIVLGSPRLFNSNDGNIDSVLSISNFKKYLENPFKYKFNHLLAKSETDDEIINNQYEQLDNNRLTEYQLIKNIIESGNPNDEKSLSEYTHLLPEKAIGSMYYKEYENKAMIVKSIIDIGGYVKKQLDSLEFTALDASGNIIQNWTMKCNVDMYAKNNNHELYYIEPVDGHADVDPDKPIEQKYFFNAYIFSLMDLIENFDDGEEYNITINIGYHEKKYHANSNKAKEILSQLYTYMNDYNNTHYIDYKLLEDIKNAKDIPENISELKEKLKNSSEWKYWNDKALISIPQDFGYDDSNIQTKLLNEASKLNDCILFA